MQLLGSSNIDLFASSPILNCTHTYKHTRKTTKEGDTNHTHCVHHSYISFPQFENSVTRGADDKLLILIRYYGQVSDEVNV